MYKAKYYPSSNILSADPGYNPSFVWRSLVKGLGLLKGGLRWVVGNRHSIKVWEDRWIPRLFSLKPIGSYVDKDPILGVDDLIDWSLKAWDDQTVREMFMPMDADLILRMRLLDPLIQNERVRNF